MSAVIERYTASDSIEPFAAVCFILGAPGAVKMTEDSASPFVGVAGLKGALNPGDPVDVILFGPTKARVTGACEVGDGLMWDANGYLRKTTAGRIVARAMASTPNGEILHVLVLPGYLP